MKQQIVDDPNGWYSVLGETPEQRQRALSEGGLDIVTTLDPDWQKAAQKAANAPWDSTPQNPGYEPEPDVGIVSLETHTGAIRTMLSGRDYLHDQINTVTTQHPPGSSFKPYVLAAAFEQGIPPTATYSGAQGPIPECPNGDGTVWSVTNAEGTSLGSLDLYDATADSVNAVFARLIVDVGPENVVDMAHRAGITTYLPPYCSLATGSVGITPLDQASGYQTFANSGIHCTPYAVTSISRGRHELFEQVPDCNRVVSADVANLVTELLKGPVTYGTAASRVLRPVGRLAASRQDRHLRPQQGALVRGATPGRSPPRCGWARPKHRMRCPTTGGTPSSAAPSPRPSGGHTCSRSCRDTRRASSQPQS